MADWDECITTVKNMIDPSAKEISQVDWSTISIADLKNGFAGDRPFPLICQGRHCIEGVNQSPAAHRFCNCTKLDGSKYPPDQCTPKLALTPFPATVCVDVKNPGNSSIWNLTGDNCRDQGGANAYNLACYCCCSCYANGTLIGVPMGFKKIEEFQVGDKVMTASISGEAGNTGLVWEPGRVDFSHGTGDDGVQPNMVYLHYGDSGSMVCTPDQLFMLESGKIKRGDRLVPGRDQLVDPNGDPVELHEIGLGVYHGGVHHIATKNPFNGDLQGHLLNSAGIVTGDFDLQIHADQLKDQFLVENHDQLPVVGSAAYEAAYPELTKADVATYSAGTGPNPDKPLQFFAHKDKRYDIPADAASYLSAAQADDIAAAKLGITFDTVSHSTQKVNNLLATFGGHYKKIEFVLLMGHMEVNAFAYTFQDKSFVALTHGLTRLKGMDIEGLALILAHLINRLSKSLPIGANGWMSVGMADYYSGGDISGVYFGSQAAAVVSKGKQQLQEGLFDHISSANEAYADDPYKPTPKTRRDALDAGFSMGFPPPGIGGPEEGGLRVVGATVSAPQFNADSFTARNISAADSAAVFKLLTDNGILNADGTLKASVTPKTDLSFLFKDATDPETRTHLIETVRSILIDADHEVAVQFNLSTGNRPIHPEDFEFTPTALVDGLTKRTNGGGDIGVVKAKLEAGNYTVKVSDVLSDIGSTLSPDHNSAQFTVN